MKQFSLFLVLFTLIVSCKNMDQYKAGIEALSTKFDKTTSTLSDLAKMVDSEKKSVAEFANNMKVDSVAFKKLKVDDQTKYNAAKESLDAAGSGFDNILGEVAQYTDEWVAKSAEMQSLKKASAENKLEGDIQGTINGLTSFVSDSENKFTAWKDNFTKVQEAVNMAKTNFATVKESLFPAKK